MQSFFTFYMDLVIRYKKPHKNKKNQYKLSNGYISYFSRKKNQNILLVIFGRLSITFHILDPCMLKFVLKTTFFLQQRILEARFLRGGWTIQEFK